MLRSPNTGIRPVSYDVAENMVTLAGIPVERLAEEHGTPLYILDEATMTAMMRAYKEGYEAYPGEVQIMFAAKSNESMGICALVEREGFGMDVVSGGELYTAIHARFPLERVLFNGNNKTIDELELAISHDVGLISVDNFYELDLIDTVARSEGKKVKVVLRITPGIECHTHDYIKTGHLESKFGFDLNQLSRAIDRIVQEFDDTIELVGLHSHIGSQIFETRPYSDLIEVMLNLFFNIRKEYGITLTHLNLGGGMGVCYGEDDDPPQVAEFSRSMVEKLVTYAQQIDYPLPKLILEPGRSLVATAGVTLYTVGSMKTIPELNKTYVAVDGGMGDNIRPALYGARYSAMVANKADEPHSREVTVAGKYCESGDILIKSFMAPESIESGDLLLVFGTGAYNYSMSSNYNRMPRPAVVLVKDGESYELVRRETWDDLISKDVIPDFLLNKVAQ